MTEPTRAMLRGGPGSDAIVQFIELPMNLYWQQSTGADVHFFKGDLRVAVSVEMPYHHYRRSFTDTPTPEGVWCYYDYIGIVPEANLPSSVGSETPHSNLESVSVGASELKVGDLIHHREVPPGVFDVKVLEVATCGQRVSQQGEDDCQQQIVRITDPGSGEDDWVHAEEFEVVRRAD